MKYYITLSIADPSLETYFWAEFKSGILSELFLSSAHDDVIKWKHFPRYWPFVRGIHRSPANSPHKGQWRRVLMFSLICARINGSVNNRKAGDLRRHRAHYDVIIMLITDAQSTKCLISTLKPFLITHRSRVTHGCIKAIIGSDDWFGHFLNQCWIIVNWTTGNKFQWNWNKNTICIRKNNLEISFTN